MISDKAPFQTVEHPFMTKQKRRQTPCFHCNCSDARYPRHIPLIRNFDTSTQRYIAGPELFCSLACAKAYILEVYCIGAIELHHLSHFAINYLGFKKPIEPAPPKAWLTSYGGPIHIDEYRNARELDSVPKKKFINPPFVPRHTTFENFESCTSCCTSCTPCTDLSQIQTT